MDRGLLFHVLVGQGADTAEAEEKRVDHDDDHSKKQPVHDNPPGVYVNDASSKSCQK
jgi:hypothetical protein